MYNEVGKRITLAVCHSSGRAQNNGILFLIYSLKSFTLQKEYDPVFRSFYYNILILVFFYVSGRLYTKTFFHVYLSRIFAESVTLAVWFRIVKFAPTCVIILDFILYQRIHRVKLLSR